MPACEVRLFASPQTVLIDEPAAHTEGQSTITAQVFDDRGRAMIGASVGFTTSAGTSTSGGAPTAVKTDANGVATDILSLALRDVPEAETFSARTTVTLDDSQSRDNESHIVSYLWDCGNETSDAGANLDQYPCTYSNARAEPYVARLTVPNGRDVTASGIVSFVVTRQGGIR